MPGLQGNANHWELVSADGEFYETDAGRRNNSWLEEMAGKEFYETPAKALEALKKYIAKNLSQLDNAEHSVRYMYEGDISTSLPSDLWAIIKDTSKNPAVYPVMEDTELEISILQINVYCKAKREEDAGMDPELIGHIKFNSGKY